MKKNYQLAWKGAVLWFTVGLQLQTTANIQLGCSARYFSETGIFVKSGTLSFLNWVYRLEKNQLVILFKLLQQHKIWTKLFMDWGGSRTTEVRKSSSSYIMYGMF